MSRTPPGQTRERVYRCVRERLLEGNPPTVREIQEALGFRAVESARAHLAALVRQGRLIQDVGKARGYRLPEFDSGGPFPYAARPRLVPLLGRVPAGPLDLAIENPDALGIDDYIPVHGRYRESAGHELFALRVEGNSMTGAGIFDGDLVIVRQQPTALSGQVVVAQIEDEATVKVFRRVLPEQPRRNVSSLNPGPAPSIELHPCNPDYPVIYPHLEGLRILGLVMEVRRSLNDSLPTTITPSLDTGDSK